MSIQKITVLGAGNMGSQIAALLVNAGLEVTLLDIVIDETDPNKLSKAAFDRITDKRKGLLYDHQFATRLSYGNFRDDLVEPSDSDLFIEAVSENLAIKHDLFAKVSKVAKETAILTSNTSGIPIKDVAKVLPESQGKRFLGLHFFNPPRHMKLVEIIPHEGTDEGVKEELSNFASRILGKGIVQTKDVSGFVANRIGVYALMDVMARAEKLGLSVSEVDALTGPVIGRPKTATYRLMDLVGVDIAYHVAKGMQADPLEKDRYIIADSAKILVDKGFLGNKTKQGYYKKDGKTILEYDLSSGDYMPIKKVERPFLETLGRDLIKNFKAIFEGRNSDDTARFIWESLANVIYYSAVNVPLATADYKNIDRAMVWGYNWKLGPFQIWDAIGFQDVKECLKAELGPLPDWIEERQSPFYGSDDSISQVAGLKSYIRGSVWQHAGVSDLYETDKDLLILVMRSPNNTVTYDFCQDLIQAVKTLNSSHYRAMVLYSEGPNFSLGANVADMSRAIEEGKVETEVAGLIDAIQTATSAMKYSLKPIVTASKGRALGGGAEVLLYSPFVVAAAESYIGLVEIGVGVIPSGGGLAELAERIYLKKAERAEEITQLKAAFNHVIFAKTSNNAYEARRMGLLRETDMIIQNEELVLEAALRKADLEASYTYMPKTRLSYPVEGSNFRALAQAQLAALVAGDFATNYEEVIATEVATVLAGGDIPLGTPVDQAYLLSLEKQGFLALCQNEKTLERMKHMLATKRVLRN